jgi:hypothetical protein
MAMNLLMLRKEKDIVEKRRDTAFSELLDLLAERRRVLGIVSDRADMSGMRFVAS